MRVTTLWRLAFGACLFALVALEASAAPPSAIEISFRDPANFSDVDRNETARQAWLDNFAADIQRRDSAWVPAGDKLLVTFTDIQRAGLVKPGPTSALHDIRIVRDTTPPRLALSFQLVDANGQVLKSGERKLHDIDFMYNARFHAGFASDYEEILVDDWVRQEFGPPKP